MGLPGKVSRGVGPDFRAMDLARGHSHHHPATVRPPPACFASFLNGYNSPQPPEKQSLPPPPSPQEGGKQLQKQASLLPLHLPQPFASTCRLQANCPPSPHKFYPCLEAWGRGRGGMKAGLRLLSCSAGPSRPPTIEIGEPWLPTQAPKAQPGWGLQAQSLK